MFLCMLNIVDECSHSGYVDADHSLESRYKMSLAHIRHTGIIDMIFSIHMEIFPATLVYNNV